MPHQPVIVVDIIQTVFANCVVANPDGGNFTINYQPGRDSQIIKSLIQLDDSETMQGLKYPLGAMQMPFKEEIGYRNFYGKVTIPRIVIAYLTKSGGGEEAVLEKYDSAGVFKTILYPLYYEFLRQLSRSPNVNVGSMDMFPHQKMDNPGQQVTSGTTDYIDSIEILNLEFILLQIKTC